MMGGGAKIDTLQVLGRFVDLLAVTYMYDARALPSSHLRINMYIFFYLSRSLARELETIADVYGC